MSASESRSLAAPRQVPIELHDEPSSSVHHTSLPTVASEPHRPAPISSLASLHLVPPPEAATPFAIPVEPGTSYRGA